MFHTDLDKRTAQVADLIVNEFIRLGISTDDDPCSGLMTRVPNVVTDEVLIEVYDDSASGFYDGEGLLTHLRSLAEGSVSLDSEDVNNVWQSIASFEV